MCILNEAQIINSEYGSRATTANCTKRMRNLPRTGRFFSLSISNHYGVRRTLLGRDSDGKFKVTIFCILNMRDKLSHTAIMTHQSYLFLGSIPYRFCTCYRKGAICAFAWREHWTYASLGRYHITRKGML